MLLILLNGILFCISVCFKILEKNIKVILIYLKQIRSLYLYTNLDYTSLNNLILD